MDWTVSANKWLYHVISGSDLVANGESGYEDAAFSMGWRRTNETSKTDIIPDFEN